MAKGSVQRTPSGRWRARWRSTDGKHRSRTFAQKRDAERFVQREIVDIEQGKAGFSNTRGTLTDLLEPWWEATRPSVKPRSAERYEWARRVIEERIGDTKLADLNAEMIQRFVNDLGVTYKPRTVSSIVGVLNLILGHGVDRGKVRPVKPPKLPRVGAPKLTIPTAEEVERLSEACDLRIRAAVILAGYCGLREGEVLALHRRDVNLTDGWVFVHQAMNKTTRALESTKTDKARRVYLPDRARDALGLHLAEFDGELLFPISGSVFQKWWERSRASVGMNDVRFHDLRHAAASMMIHAGWSVTQVAKQLGHADPAMTLRTYSHLWPDSYDDAITKLNTYLGHDASASGSPAGGSTLRR